METVDASTAVHFALYFCLGLVVRDRYILAFSIGIIWELFEYFVTRNFTELLTLYWPIPRRYWDETNYNRTMDIFANMAGYTMGNVVYKRFIQKPTEINS